MRTGKQGRLARRDWPNLAQDMDAPQLRGIFVGGCVDRGVGSSFRAKAHAHTSGSNEGFLCYRSSRWLDNKLLGLHELAHLISGHGHNDIWRETLLEIGGTLDEIPDVLQSYHKQKRGKRHHHKWEPHPVQYNPDGRVDRCSCGATRHVHGESV